MNEKHKNLLILLLSCSLFICLIMMFALLPRDGGNGLAPIDKKTENKVFENYYIYTGSNTGVIYVKNDGSCLDKDGRLSGDCYIESLRNKKFVSYTEGVSDVGPAMYVVLSEDNELYYIHGAIEGYDPEVSSKVKSPFNGNVEKIGTIINDESDECVYDRILVASIDGKEYIDRNGKTLLTDYYDKNHRVKNLFGYVCGERPEKAIGFNAYRNLLNINSKVVKDKDTKEEIVLDYVMYDDEERKEVYIVGNDKLYLLEDEKDEYAKVLGKIKDIHVVQDKGTFTITNTTNVTIELEDGSVVAFIRSNK